MHKEDIYEMTVFICFLEEFTKVLNELIKSIRQVQLHIDQTSKTEYEYGN